MKSKSLLVIAHLHILVLIKVSHQVDNVLLVDFSIPVFFKVFGNSSTGNMSLACPVDSFKCCVGLEFT